MRLYSNSEKAPQKPRNEDLFYDEVMGYGHLFVVLDFAAHTMANIGLTLPGELKARLKALESVPGFTTSQFLGYAAQEINNHVYTLGQKFCGGKLFCVAALALLQGNRLHYVTYGDARINLLTGDRLLLLNGAKFQTPTIIGATQESPDPINENPEQMGRQYFERPLIERVQAVTLADGDVVLMFSDGLEEKVTPQSRLEALRGAARSDPEDIYKALMNLSGNSSDDRTLTVICGPYEPYADPEFQALGREVVNLRKSVGDLLKQQTDLARFPGEVSTLSDSVKRVFTELGNLRTALSTKAEGNGVKESLDRAINNLRNELTTKAKEPPKGGAGGRDQLNPQAVQQLIEKALTPARFEQVFKGDPKWWSEMVGIGSSTESQGGGADGAGGQDTAAEAKGGGQMPLVRHKDIATIKPPVSETTFWDRLKSGQYVSARHALPIMGAIVIGFILGLVAERYFLAEGEQWSVQTGGTQAHLVRHYDDQDVSLSFPTRQLNDGRKYFTNFAAAKQELDTVVRAPEPGPTVRQDEGQAVERTTDVVIQSGDTLGKLAEKHRVTQDQLKEVNPEVTNWNAIKPGDRVRVPRK